MRWSEVATDTLSRPLDGRLAEGSFVRALGLLQAVSLGPRVILAREVRASITDHLLAARTELGGLLLGRAFSPPDGAPPDWGHLIVIDDFVPSCEQRSTRVSLAMGTRLWDDARRSLEGTARTIVGWYHSHPNLGAFFSGTDRKTQRHFFPWPYSLGLVMDPLRGEEAWFVGPDAVPLPRPPDDAMASRDLEGGR